MIIDGLIMNIEGLKEHYATLIRFFHEYPLNISDIHCDMEILRKRNLIRGDRGELQSIHQSKCAEENIEIYGIIDSRVNDVVKCADLLEQIMD